MVLPLGGQLNGPRLARWAIGGVGLVAALALVLISRSPELPAADASAAIGASAPGRVLADWRWAPELQRRAGAGRSVWAAGGPASESTEFWLDYLRVAQGHERWAEILRAYQIGVLVLDARDRERLAAELIRTSTDWRVLADDGQVLVAERAGS
jgi:hypothetical protein